MRVLLLGYSAIARKRIVPALHAINAVEGLDIACQRRDADIVSPLPGTIYHDYAEALADSRADVVYISLINSLHAEWAEAALIAGYHVIIDKPAFTRLSDATRLVELAQRKRRLLAEATVFACHPQIKAIRETFVKYKTSPSRISAVLSFPPLDEANFRYGAVFGGGALLDLGPYAIAAGQLFFDDAPERLEAVVNHHNGEVEVSFSVLAKYRDGQTMVGHFGFDTEYQNSILLLGNGLSIAAERIFTIPADKENILAVRRHDSYWHQRVPAADCFKNYFEMIFDALDGGDIQRYSQQLLQAAQLLEQLVLSARGAA